MDQSSFSGDPGQTGAHGVRGLPSAEIFPFPADAVVRRRPRLDQVVVTHNGETRIYESPEALYAVFRADDPRIAADMAKAEETLNAARQALAHAVAMRERYHAKQTLADRILSHIGAGALIATALGLVLLAAL